MIHLVLLAIGLAVAYIVLVLASPMQNCPRCKGTRIDRTTGRIRACRTCFVTGRIYRPGARMIHGLYWLIVRYLRERRREEPSTAKETEK